MVSRPSGMDFLAGEFGWSRTQESDRLAKVAVKIANVRDWVGRLGDALALSGNAKSFAHELVSKCLSLRQMSLSVST